MYSFLSAGLGLYSLVLLFGSHEVRCVSHHAVLILWLTVVDIVSDVQASLASRERYNLIKLAVSAHCSCLCLSDSGFCDPPVDPGPR